MPFEYSINSESNLIFVVAHNILTPVHLQDYVESYLHEPAFHDEIDILIELRKNIEIVFDEEEIIEDVARKIRAVRQKKSYRMACAGGYLEMRSFFLASLRMMNNYAESRAFATTQEALEWLGVNCSRADLVKDLRAAGK